MWPAPLIPDASKPPIRAAHASGERSDSRNGRSDMATAPPRVPPRTPSRAQGRPALQSISPSVAPDRRRLRIDVGRQADVGRCVDEAGTVAAAQVQADAAVLHVAVQVERAGRALVGL